MKSTLRISIGFLLASMMCMKSSCAKTIRLNPETSWFTTLSGPTLNPGDEVVLEGGVYSDARRLEISQRGTRDKPIVIRASEGAKVVIRRPDARQNSINLLGCQHLILHGIEITGGSSGIRIGGKNGHAAKFITLENLHIHHIGGVAVTANFAGEIYQAMCFRGNHIHHTGGHGEAFYLGSNNAADGSTHGYIYDSIIETNYIHDLRGAAVSQGDGIELKDGSFNNIVRDNVIHDTHYPGIIVYSTDGKPPNVIERNVIWNCDDHGIQAAADAVIRNNIVYETRGAGIYCRNHQSAVVGNLMIVNNTVRSPSAIRIIAPERFSGSVVVANNAVSGTLRLPASRQILAQANVTGIKTLFPGVDSKCVAAAQDEYLPEDDFNGDHRGEAKDCGAYRFNALGNPGWRITAGFKQSENIKNGRSSDPGSR